MIKVIQEITCDKCGKVEPVAKENWEGRIDMTIHQVTQWGQKAHTEPRVWDLCPTCLDELKDRVTREGMGMAQQIQAACERILFGFAYDERPQPVSVEHSTFPCLCGKRFLSYRALKGHISASKPKGSHADLLQGVNDDRYNV